jgi:PEP-CTERM motif
MKLVKLALAGSLLLLALGLASSAKASTVDYTLSANNLGLGGPIGDISVSDVGGGVQVSISMDAGFSLKLNGGDIAFNLSDGATPGAITFDSITFGVTTINNPVISIGKFGSKHISIFGDFAYDIQNLKCAHSSCGNGVVSADDLVFTIAGLSTSDFGTGSDWAVHFCTASGSQCGPQTGFASTQPGSETPEPGSLFLLGTGLLAVGGAIRRKLSF